VTDFAAVDTGDARGLVAMMDATDAWPAVRAARAWVFEQIELAQDAVVVDAGCGPGTFGTAVGAMAGGCAVDLDASHVMLRETRRRRADARVVLGDVAHLPLRDCGADLVRVERVLQWTADPEAALTELLRVVVPGGWLAVTDTDWSTLRVEHPDDDATARLTRAALRWVPHARVARELPSALTALGAHDVGIRHDTATITAWDPDDPAQHDGPPGLPLHSIAGDDAADLAPVIANARAGTFRADVTLVSVVGRRSSPLLHAGTV
jgi:SAM-dependent methyltransferase